LPIRITDQKGNPILPGTWDKILQPKMTIIVDSCSQTPQNQQDDGYQPYQQRSQPYQSRKSSEYRRRTASEGSHKWFERAATAPTPVLARRKTGGGFTGHPGISPAVVKKYGQAEHLAQLNALEKKDYKTWGGWGAGPFVNKRNAPTTASSSRRNRSASNPTGGDFTRSRSLASEKYAGYKSLQPAYSPTARKALARDGEGKERSEPSSIEQKARQSKWSKITKAMLFMVSAGSGSTNYHTEDCVALKISRQAASSKLNGHTCSCQNMPKISDPISMVPKRPTRATTLPPNNHSLQTSHDRTSPPMERKRLRSKSSSYSSKPSIIRSLSASQPKQLHISPPIPPRPSIDLELDSQYSATSSCGSSDRRPSIQDVLPNRYSRNSTALTRSSSRGTLSRQSSIGTLASSSSRSSTTLGRTSSITSQSVRSTRSCSTIASRCMAHSDICNVPDERAVCSLCFFSLFFPLFS
jgi:hypothetical protein